MTGPMLHTVDVDSDAQRIYEAITTQAGEAAFWTSDCDVEPAVGSIARFGFPSAPVDLRMQIDELSPGQRIRWSCLGDFPHWAGTTVTLDALASAVRERDGPRPSVTMAGMPTIPTTSTRG